MTSQLADQGLPTQPRQGEIGNQEIQGQLERGNQAQGSLPMLRGEHVIPLGFQYPDHNRSDPGVVFNDEHSRPLGTTIHAVG